jgi:hypothetical protein
MTLPDATLVVRFSKGWLYFHLSLAALITALGIYTIDQPRSGAQFSGVTLLILGIAFGIGILWMGAKYRNGVLNLNPTGFIDFRQSIRFIHWNSIKEMVHEGDDSGSWLKMKISLDDKNDPIASENSNDLIEVRVNLSCLDLSDKKLEAIVRELWANAKGRAAAS